MHLTSVWILINELCSFFLHADWMENFRVIKKIENVTSDIRFLEECVRIGWIPNGFKWKFKAQGLKAEDDRKIECIKKDATLPKHTQKSCWTNSEVKRSGKEGNKRRKTMGTAKNTQIELF